MLADEFCGRPADLALCFGWMPWDPAQYERFKAERELPFVDASALIGPLREGSRIIDLGCGTGALTRKLADAHPTARVLGIDTSPQMLEEAKGRERPGLRFVRGAIEAVDQIGPDLIGEVSDDPRWDLVFSHAAIHWVPDHERLVPRLFARVATGGRLVVQLPSNHNATPQRTLGEVADEAPYRAAASAPVAERPVLSAVAYAELLWRAGGQQIVAFEKVYPHVMPDSDAVVEFMKGTAAVPYLERLPPALREPFLARFRERLRERMPDTPLFFGFRRTFFAASA
jgi:trans-aconitate 2-methyltransferase